jgi:hypothetical protein
MLHQRHCEKTDFETTKKKTPQSYLCLAFSAVIDTELRRELAVVLFEHGRGRNSSSF